MNNKKPLMADILFNKLKEELANNSFEKLEGLFVISVLNKGVTVKDWYLLFQGAKTQPQISNTRPYLNVQPDKKPLPVVLIQIEDKDLVNFAAGGISGVQGFMTGRVKIAGDFLLAQQLEEIFVQAGGVEKTMDYIKRYGQSSKL